MKYSDKYNKYNSYTSYKNIIYFVLIFILLHELLTCKNKILIITLISTLLLVVLDYIMINRVK